MPPATTVVAHPCDETSLRGLVEAAEAGIIVPILVGPGRKISAVAREHGIDIDRFELVSVSQDIVGAVTVPLEIVKGLRGYGTAEHKQSGQVVGTLQRSQR